MSGARTRAIKRARESTDYLLAHANQIEYHAEAGSPALLRGVVDEVEELIAALVGGPSTVETLDPDGGVIWPNEYKEFVSRICERDPRVWPQPGDSLALDGKVRRVVKVTHHKHCYGRDGGGYDVTVERVSGYEVRHDFTSSIRAWRTWARHALDPRDAVEERVKALERELSALRATRRGE